MRRRWLIGSALVLTLLTLAALVVTRGMGLSARRSALPGEATLAGLARTWTLPSEYRSMTNPLEPTADAIRAGMEHWADHCASCHGNDGSGNTTLGRGLFPPAPDMRVAATQDRSDGALFYAIEQGIPFTGMPAWSTGTESGRRSSWELVLFIRHLPRITPEELRRMEALNPKSAAELERERQIQDFLKGGGR